MAKTIGIPSASHGITESELCDRVWYLFFQRLASQAGTSGVTAGTFGDSTHVGQFTVDSNGRITFAQNVAIAGVGPEAGYWSELTDGDPTEPELIFTSFGDTIDMWVPTP